MPIYEYECSKCGVFDEMQKITDKPLSKCPTCKRKVKKLMSNTAFQLKGSGWYITDYGKGGQKGPGGGGESKSDDSSSTESSGAKPAAKKDTKKKKGGAKSAA